MYVWTSSDSASRFSSTSSRIAAATNCFRIDAASNIVSVESGTLRSMSARPQARFTTSVPFCDAAATQPGIPGWTQLKILLIALGFIRGFSLRACRSGKEQDGGEPEQGGCDPDMQFHMTLHTGIIGFRTAGVVTLR